MIWHVYAKPTRAEAASVLLGNVTGDTRTEAHESASCIWPTGVLDLISEASWDTMTDGQRAFYTGKPVGDESFRQISPDVRSSKCETCAGEIFYRKHRSNQWRKPPTHCPTCKPSPAVSAPRVHAAYLPET